MRQEYGTNNFDAIPATLTPPRVPNQQESSRRDIPLLANSTAASFESSVHGLTPTGQRLQLEASDSLCMAWHGMTWPHGCFLFVPRPLHSDMACAWRPEVVHFPCSPRSNLLAEEAEQSAGPRPVWSSFAVPAAECRCLDAKTVPLSRSSVRETRRRGRGRIRDSGTSSSLPAPLHHSDVHTVVPGPALMSFQPNAAFRRLPRKSRWVMLSTFARTVRNEEHHVRKEFSRMGQKEYCSLYLFLLGFLHLSAFVSSAPLALSLHRGIFWLGPTSLTALKIRRVC